MKGLLAVTLCAALLAAGCLSGDDATTAAVDGVGALSTLGVVHGAAGVVLRAPGDLVQAAGGQYHTGRPASEPTIAVTSDGSIFITGSSRNPTCAVAGGCPVVPYANFNAGPTIMRSMDKGQSWEDVFPKLPTGDSYKLRTWDPYVLVDRDTDRVFMDDIYPISCGFLSYTDDLGASWMHNPYSCGNSQVNDHQTLVTAKPRVLTTAGYPNLVYRCVNNLFYAACAVSLNGGLTFLPQVPVGPTLERNGCAAITGHLEADAEGRVYLGAPCGPGTDYPGVMVTEDDGRTWRMSLVSDAHELDGHDVDLATDEAGNVYAFFLSGALPYLSVSTDHGATWSEPQMVAAPDVTMANFNAIAAGAPGKVAFAYVGTTMPDAPRLPRAQCGLLPAFPCTEPEEWAAATWNAYVGVIEDALAPELVIQTVVANDPADPIARGACADRCHGMTDFIDIDIDAEGRPWASFVDVCIAECVTDASVPFDGNLGFAATLVRGPALRGELRELPVLAPPPLRASG
ncbi:MAG TPA: sialidase family protein [Candidatus Thermoplasmatota archaeon]|nr:sialidase family protein [Candidatus Thermoplasmatota archaeon]